MSGLNHTFHMQEDPNKALAKRIVKMYGGNVKEITKFLTEHPITQYTIADGSQVIGFEGILYVSESVSSSASTSSSGNSSSGSMIPAEKVIPKAVGWVIGKVFKVGGSLLTDGGLAKSGTMPPNAEFIKSARLFGRQTAEQNLIIKMFGPSIPLLNTTDMRISLYNNGVNNKWW